MKFFQFLLIALLTIGITACSESNHKEKNPAPTNFTLKSNQAGPFIIGDAIPDSSEQFAIQKEQRPGPEGTPPQQTIYIVSQQGNKLAMLTPKYDSENQSYTNTIAEIMVLSDRFKTEEGIGVGSTIEEFTSSYTDYNLWYTYVSDRFVLETSQHSMQFLLQKKDYAGGEINFESEITPLKIDNFNSESTIHKVRIF